MAIEQLRWARIPVESGKEHPHAFYRDGDDKRVVKVEVDASKGKDKLVGRVSAGVSDLLGGLRVFFLLSLPAFMWFNLTYSFSMISLEVHWI